MPTMTTADAAFKYVYEDIVKQQLNMKTSAIYNKIAPSDKNIVLGKKIVKLAPFGVNGGFGAGSETGAFPIAGENNMINFESDVKNMYGVIEISDKAMIASRSDRASFVNLLKTEMDGLLEGAKFNYARQLYGDGLGKLTLCALTTPAALTINVVSCQYLMEGMIIDIRNAANALISNGTQRRIVSMDRAAKTISFAAGGATVATAVDDYITVQNSYNLELTGFGKIFSTDALYGVTRTTHTWMQPKMHTSFGDLTDKKLILDRNEVEDMTGGVIDYIACAPDVEAEYYDYLESMKRAPEPLTLEGGFKALSFSGIPLARDRFIGTGEIYMLDTKQFTFHYLADWSWMDDDGKILKQVAGYPKWTAQIRKYGDLICDHPGAQIHISGVTV